MSDHLAANLANWEERAGPHARSPEYAVARLIGDPAALSGVVEFDRTLLGDLAGLVGCHLQCHIGTDTLSLHRLGAQMTGLDFSPAALAEARALAAAADADIDFVQARVDDAVPALGSDRFDLVYTGVGALCWLPSISTWAAVVAALLRPGGRLFLREAHPVLWACADPATGETDPRLAHPYFEQSEPLCWDEPGTYVTTDVEFVHTATYEWNHGLGEIITALLGVGMRLTGLVEHTSVPYDALPGLMTPDDRGEWHLTDDPERLPASYTLQAVKTG